MTTEIEETKKEPLYKEAIRAVVDNQKSNISFVQRTFRVGYNHAARLVEAMEHDGILAPMDRLGNRKILVTPNVPHEGPGAASSRTVPLDAVVVRQRAGT